MTDVIKYERRGAVAIITLSRPESMNAFDEALRAGVVKAFEQARGDESVRAVVFTGEGRCFSAGADLKAGIDRDVATILQTEYRPALEAIATIPKPVIAAVPGSAAAAARTACRGMRSGTARRAGFGSGSGRSVMEAPRGGLAHWIVIENRRISNYQAVVPSTWNAGPRDAKGQPGAYEAALADNHELHDPEQPVEILRTIHSFDPCIACAVHVTDPDGEELVKVKVR